MEIMDKIVQDKITMIISDYNTNLEFSDSHNIYEFIEKKVVKKNIVVIDNIKIDFYELSVLDVINKFLTKYNVRGKKFVDKVLKLSTLPVDYLNKDPFLLKESEKFKLLLALVLALNPKVIIIKNISCFSDNKSRDEVMFTLKKLKREYDKTIVIVDNDIDYFYTVSDNVLIIDNSEVIISGKKNLLFDNYSLLKRKKIPIPVHIEFIKYVKDNTDADMLIRDDVKDIMKDIYRSL